MAHVREKQVEMRQVLFCKENFHNIFSFLDFGCGLGTDVIQMARSFPHIKAHGFTITKAQAELGNKRISHMNLSARAEIFNKDSSKDPFLRKYDLIVGFEVCCHINNKPMLFHNIVSSLNDEGRVLLIDFIANLRGGIVDTNVGINIATIDEWLDLLTQHNLLIYGIIDASPQVANFLYDPKRDEYIKDIPEVGRDFLINNTNNFISLDKGWLSYCLIKLKKNTDLSGQDLKDQNALKISNKTMYPEALKEMLKMENIPYPKSEHDKKSIQQESIPQDVLIKTEDTEINQVQDIFEVKNKLINIFNSVLEFSIEDIQTAEAFGELGINSINAVELLEAINTSFNLNMPTSVIFENNSLDTLAKHIAHQPTKKKDETNDENQVVKANHHIASTHTTSPPLAKLDISGNPMAIIGMSGKFPTAENVNEFWNNIVAGKKCITEVPKSRWNWEKIYGDPLKENNKTSSKWGGFINGVEDFDPIFFGISPREAELMDPQQRLLLTCVWETIEDAGIVPNMLAQKPTGVFISPGMNQYMNIVSIPRNDPFAITGMALSSIPNRISYTLNLNGPSEYCETACSSTLVALHRAVVSICTGECEQAIIGAVNLLLSPDTFIYLSAEYLSRNGEPKPFQKEADGFVLSEGVGSFIIKPLQKAIHDNNRIYAVIRGTGVNHGGKGMSLTVPTAKGMKSAMSKAYKASGIDPRTVSYVEAHGTAMPIGDAVEMDALKSGYSEIATSCSNISRKEFPCYISSLKPCIGHAEIASGMAAIIKVVMALNHKTIPGYESSQ